MPEAKNAPLTQTWQQVFTPPQQCTKLCLAPVQEILKKKLLRKNSPTLEMLAEREWQIAPGSTYTKPPSYYLPNQLERVTAWVFANDNPIQMVEGNITMEQAPTRGYVIRNAWLIDGVLYKDGACSYLHPRDRNIPPKITVETEIERAAVYCSFIGNKYFGSWLLDDCLTYPLTLTEGIPVTTHQTPSAHTLAYEKLLNMSPQRLKSAFFKELVIFNDFGQNNHRRNRYLANRQKFLSNQEPQPHAGVFILRGSTGEQRKLINELELAEYMRDKRGFRILDITKADVATIINTCAGARVVMGVEGSQLMHGFQLQTSNTAMLILQPPNRCCYTYKDKADRDGQYFGFVVGIDEAEGFRVDFDEVERTLDLFPASLWA
jgi:hypothetical protein